MCRPVFNLPPQDENIQAPSLTRAVPEFSEDEWNKLDAEFNKIQGPLHHLMGMDEIPSDIAMDQYTELLHNFLVSNPLFQKEALTHYTHTPPTTLPEARKVKKI